MLGQTFDVIQAGINGRSKGTFIDNDIRCRCWYSVIPEAQPWAPLDIKQTTSIEIIQGLALVRQSLAIQGQALNEIDGAGELVIIHILSGPLIRRLVVFETVIHGIVLE